MNVRFTLQIVLLTTITALTATFVSAGAAGVRDGRSADTKDAARLAHQAATSLDLRSPDTRDAARLAHQTATSLDLRSPDTRDAGLAAHQQILVPADGRSPDTIDAAVGRLQGRTEIEYDASMARSAALNALYGNAVTRLTPGEFASLWRNGGSHLKPQELVALVERSQALNKRFGGGSLATPTPAEVQAQHARDVGMNRLAASGVFATPTQSAGDGFDWSAFGIGAGGMFGLLVVAVGVLAVSGRKLPSARVS